MTTKETYPDPLHNCSCHGPNLYQVNTYFVKPKTLAAGGMSYALWLHPGGLPCEVFISHAWAEFCQDSVIHAICVLVLLPIKTWELVANAGSHRFQVALQLHWWLTVGRQMTCWLFSNSLQVECGKMKTFGLPL